MIDHVKTFVRPDPDTALPVFDDRGHRIARKAVLTVEHGHTMLIECGKAPAPSVPTHSAFSPVFEDCAYAERSRDRAGRQRVGIDRRVAAKAAVRTHPNATGTAWRDGPGSVAL